jgi:copper chaperone
MYQLEVGEMSCGHCAGAVTKSVLEVDANAKVEVDLVQKRVKVESSAELADIAAAIDAAGYPVLSSSVV